MLPQWLKNLGANIVTHKDVVVAVSTLVSTLIALGALIATTILMRDQVDIAKRTIESAQIYQIQKDQRELSKAYRNYEATPAEIFGLMQSIYFQRQMSAITDEVWKSIERDFRKTMQQEELRDAWFNSDRSYLDEQFAAYMDEITRPLTGGPGK